MKAIQAHPQPGLDGLTLVDRPDPGDPGPHAITQYAERASNSVGSIEQIPV